MQRLLTMIALPLAWLLLASCSASSSSTSRIAGLLVDPELDEISGLAVSRRHDDVLWLLDDGGNPARLFAVSKRGRRLATFTLANLVKTDWEDLAAFEHDGKHYLLIADTGDNGGLRHSLQLHVVEEPAALDAGAQAKPLRPAWSIVFRWPDGARDCEAVAVDAKRGQILLVSKKRQPAELFTLPLQPHGRRLQVAQRVGTLANPVPSNTNRQPTHDHESTRRQVTAAGISPDGRSLAVLTYANVLLYQRRDSERWQDAVKRTPQTQPFAWLPQAEAIGWATDSRGLYITGEFSPAPILLLQPPAPNQ